MFNLASDPKEHFRPRLVYYTTPIVHVLLDTGLLTALSTTTGCAKKKKDIFNIFVKSQIINIFFGKLGC